MEEQVTRIGGFFHTHYIRTCVCVCVCVCLCVCVSVFGCVTCKIEHRSTLKSIQYSYEILFFKLLELRPTHRKWKETKPNMYFCFMKAYCKGSILQMYRKEISVFENRIDRPYHLVQQNKNLLRIISH